MLYFWWVGETSEEVIWELLFCHFIQLLISDEQKLDMDYFIEKYTITCAFHE